jgi:hypothetical protein
MKAINLCIARFDEDTKEAFLDLYTKVDSGAHLDEIFEQDDDNPILDDE